MSVKCVLFIKTNSSNSSVETFLILQKDVELHESEMKRDFQKYLKANNYESQLEMNGDEHEYSYYISGPDNSSPLHWDDFFQRSAISEDRWDLNKTHRIVSISHHDFFEG